MAERQVVVFLGPAKTSIAVAFDTLAALEDLLPQTPALILTQRSRAAGSVKRSWRVVTAPGIDDVLQASAKVRVGLVVGRIPRSWIRAAVGAGLPLVARSVPPAGLGQHNKTGFFQPSAGAKQLAWKVYRLLVDDELRSRFHRASLETARLFPERKNIR